LNFTLSDDAISFRLLLLYPPYPLVVGIWSISLLLRLLGLFIEALELRPLFGGFLFWATGGSLLFRAIALGRGLAEVLFDPMPIRD